MAEKQIALGGTMKAIGEEGLIEGYAVSFTSPEKRDLHGQYFSKRTDFDRTEEEIIDIPILYHHGMDERVKRVIIGHVTKARIDDSGVWIQAQLDLRKQYARDVMELTKQEALAWSSGADPLGVEVEEDNHIRKWPFVEFSETPTPAEPVGTVINAKTYRSLIEGDTDHKESGADETSGDTQDTSNADPISQKTLPIGKTMKEQILALLAQLAEAINAALGGGMSPSDAATVTRAMEDELKTLTPEEVKALETSEEEVEKDEKTKATRKAAEDKLLIAAGRELEKAKAAKTGIIAKRFTELGTTTSITDGVGSVTNTKSTRVEVGEDPRYMDLSASDMLLAVQMRTAPMRKHMIPYDPKLLFNETFWRTLAAKTLRHRDAKHSEPYTNALKASIPRHIKADELDASNIVGQGLEWVSETWATDLWLRERAPTYFDQFVQMGMRVKVIPKGSNTVKFPTEGSDPRVFAPPEANDLDVTGKPETTANFTPIGTGNVELTAAELVLATSVTYILEEDSIIDVAPEVNRQIEETFKETRDRLILNGDTTRTASTNINFIDGTPATGIASPWYLAFNGFRKHALVTWPTQSRFGGVLEYSDFLATINLLPYAVRSNRNRIALIVTPDVETWALTLPQIATADVRPNGYTLESGTLPKIFGLYPVTSGYLPATGVAGKEYQITTANNVYGTILAVYCPYWGFGYKRQITVEMERNMYSGTIDWVARARMGMVARGADAASVTYGLSQS